MKTEFRPETHEYLIDGVRVPSITEVIRLARFVGEPVNRTAFERAGERGKEVHKLCELDDVGSAAWIEGGEHGGYLEAWRKFKMDFDFQPEIVEKPLIHETLRFGGTLDVAGMMGETFCLVERKTRSVKGYDRLQVAGQAILLRDVLERPPTRRIIIYIRKDGTYRSTEVTAMRIVDQQVFLAALQVAAAILSKEYD